jgi:Ca2+-binding RTX toxin-like protein
MAQFRIANTTGMTFQDLVVSQQSIDVYGLQGRVMDVSFELNDLTHSRVSDLDMLLSGPQSAANLVFWSDVTSDDAAAGTGSTYIISDSALSELPEVSFTGILPGASYRPAGYGAVEDGSIFGLAPGPLNHAATSGSSTFGTAFGGIDANGIWSFRVFDDTASFQGSLGSWAVTITTNSNAVEIDGTSGDDTLLVTITGGDSGTYSLNGGPAIAFSGVESLTFAGLAGNDTLIVDSTLDVFEGLVRYDGGGQAGDHLEIRDLDETVGDNPDVTMFIGGGGLNISYSDPGGQFDVTNVATVESSIYNRNVNLNALETTGTVFLEDDGVFGNGLATLRFADATMPVITFRQSDARFQLEAGGGFDGNTVTVNVDLLDPIFGSVVIGNPETGIGPASINVGRIEATEVILAASGTIGEYGSDPDADIIADFVSLSSKNGIADFSNPLETSAGIIEAQTNSGDIRIVNDRDVTIGFLRSLDDATDGQIDFQALGTITLGRSGVPIAPGVDNLLIDGQGVRLVAIGGDSDIVKSVDGRLIEVAGNAVIEAGRYLMLGTEGDTSNIHTITAGLNATLLAGRDIILEERADIVATQLVLEAARSIAIGQQFGPAAELIGSTSLRLSTDAGGEIALRPFAVRSTTGDVTIEADRMAIDGSITASNQPGQSVFLLPAAPGRAILLGSGGGGANALELSAAELGWILTPNLRIGDLESGRIETDGTVSWLGGSRLHLSGGGDVIVNHALTMAALSVQAGHRFIVGTSGLLDTTDTADLRISVDSPNADPGIGGQFIFQGQRSSGSLAIIGGGADDDRLDGTAFDDLFDAGEGADTMRGQAGDDVYVVDDAGDAVIELPGGGNDTVIASISYTLGANVENLILTGTANLNGTGNGLANTITGNSGDNVLAGGQGNDSLEGGQGNDQLFGGQDNDQLFGGQGNDLLNGGLGADAMTGGGDDDTYFVNDAGDTVTELAGGGVDTVNSTITHTLAAEVENLILLGSANLNGTGNGLANTITGNTGDNVLSGSIGNDTLNGGLGNDQLFGGADADQLFGGLGNDLLNGGLGADAMTGGSGNDTYFVNDAGDTVTELAGGGVDTVNSAITHTLGAEVENLILLGSANLNGTGNGLANTITGNTGDNVLSGGVGNDTLNGGQGNDQLFGGADADQLFGGLGNDLLNGGLGADAMTGGSGNDTYFVNDAGDTVTELAGGGVDTVNSAITHTLAAEVENLVLLGSANLNGTGNGLANSIIGSDGNNVLIGGAGNDQLFGGQGNDQLFGGADADTLFGGLSNDLLNGGLGADAMNGGIGDDTYVVDNVGDTVIELAGDGTDTVNASISYTLAAEVENLILTGAANLNGTGNGLANAITGNTGDNVLSGGVGNDTLNGGQGNDQLFGGADADQLFGGAGNDLLNGGLGADAMTGGGDDDTYFVNDAGDTVTELAGGGVDTVNSAITHTLAAEVENLILLGSANLNGTGNGLANTITGNTGDNVLSGGVGNDQLFGGLGNDQLFGGADADQLFGGGGNDVLAGGVGNDTLFSGGGNDTLTGGLDADVFVFSAALNAATNVDVITDYSVVDDTIHLSSAVFTGIGLGTLLASAFRFGAAALDADDRIIYQGATGNLFYDPDGVGGAAQIQFASLASGLAMSENEFVVI